MDTRKEYSIQWIKNYAAELEVDYDELLQEAKNQARDGSGDLCGSDNLEGVEVSNEFWKHFAVVTDDNFPPDGGYGDFFRCAC